MAHWADEREKGSGFWQLKLLLVLRNLLGRGFMSLVLRPVVFVFYLVSPRNRKASRDFLARAFQAASSGTVPAQPGRLDPLRHFISFAEALVDKIDAWSNKIGVKDLVIQGADFDTLVRDLKSGKGATILCSHLGNAELLRALASLEVTREIEGFSFTSIVEFSGTAKFNRLIKEIDPRSMGMLVSASDIGADTMIMLKDRVDRGGLVVIAGDRVAARNRDKIETLGFLGQEAQFPLGPFILTDLLEAPVYFMFALRKSDLDWKSPYVFSLFRASAPCGGPRRMRGERLSAMMKEYVSRLEAQAMAHPFQWYNFYDFWQRGE